MTSTQITNWVSANPVLVGGSAVAALLVATLVRRAARLIAGAWKMDFADSLTVLVALFATVYAGTGSNKYLHVAMGYGPDLRAALLVVFEGAVVVSGIRARKNIRATNGTGSAGVDGIAMWALTLLSGLLAASVSGSAGEAAGRLLVPLVGCWLWERAMAPEKRATRERLASGPVRWRITPERVFVWLRLADASATDVSTIEASRKVVRFLRATDRESNGRRWPFTAKARADRARMRLAAHALTHSGDPAEVHEQLAERMFAEALTRLGIDQDASQGEASEASQTASLTLPGDSEFAQVVASLPPARVESANGRKRVSPASRPARRQASVSARIGVDTDSVERAFRDSVEAGSPLSSRHLAELTGVSQSTAARVIRAAAEG